MIKVYNASGSLIGTATNTGATGSVTVTIAGGFPVNDASVYVTRTDSGKQESNKTEITVGVVPGIKTIAPTVFNETAADNGDITGVDAYGNITHMITLEIQNGTINNTIAKYDAVGGTGDVSVSNNLPAGLDYTVTKLDDTHLGITFTGNATANDIGNSVTSLIFTIKSTGVTPVSGGIAKDITTAPITINFNTAQMKQQKYQLIEYL